MTRGARLAVPPPSISTHTLTWSVTPLAKSITLRSRISTHTLTWSVTSRNDLPTAFAHISTHTLTWSVTPSGNYRVRAYDNFNSHAHVERDVLPTPFEPVTSIISTHTLTWSVTIINGNYLAITAISTHTLTWSVTSVFMLLTDIFLNFNSHAHVERDIVKNLAQQPQIISTHTLTWSVTCRTCLQLQNLR